MSNFFARKFEEGPGEFFPQNIDDFPESFLNFPAKKLDIL